MESNRLRQGTGLGMASALDEPVPRLLASGLIEFGGIRIATRILSVAVTIFVAIWKSAFKCCRADLALNGRRSPFRMASTATNSWRRPRSSGYRDAFRQDVNQFEPRSNRCSGDDWRSGRRYRRCTHGQTEWQLYASAHLGKSVGKAF